MSSFPNPSLDRRFFGYFDAPPMAASAVWASIHAFLQEEGHAKPNYRLDPGIGERRRYREKHLDRSATSQEILDELAKADLDGFVVINGPIGGSYLQSMAFYAAHRHHVGFQGLSVYLANAEIQLDFTGLVERLANLGHLVWLGNACSSYSTWQRWSDPTTYATRYGDISSFRTYVLHDKLRLDVSLNPGSDHVHKGAWARADSELWLGPRFWNFAPCTKEEVLAADFFIEKRETPHYLYLKSWPHPFTRPDGEQGRVQQKLWRLLYHQDCEWPPGSGNICDEPMDGPPELMPDYQHNPQNT